MNLRKSSTVLSLVVLVGFLAGCGGGGQSDAGEDQAGNRSQDGGPGGAKQQAGGEGTNPALSGTKIALGRVTSVDTEAGIIIVRPSTEEQGTRPQRFKIRGDTTITLDDEEASLADVQGGQSAQITYIVKKERNIAREVALISRGGAAPAGGEETG